MMFLYRKLYKIWYNMLYQGVAQLVARSVRDAEVVGSSPITLTIFVPTNGLIFLLRKKIKAQGVVSK